MHFSTEYEHIFDGWLVFVRFGPFVFSCFVLFDKYSAQTKKMHFDESYNLFYIDFFIVLLNCDEYTENTQPNTLRSIYDSFSFEFEKIFVLEGYIYPSEIQALLNAL